MILLKIFYESIVQAFQQLAGNKLRSFLSLLGITIGIFCIISVQSAVDSLEDNIRGSFEKLGNDVIYIQKFSWAEDPKMNYWKYFRRPAPNYLDFEILDKKMRTAAICAFQIVVGSKTVKYRSNSVERVALIGMTYDYGEMFDFKFDKGRYLSPTEYHYGSPKAVVGYTVAEELFGAIEPIGKEVKLMGRKVEIIGVLEKTGQDIISINNFDEAVFISYELAKKMANVKTNSPFGTLISVKAAENISIDELKDEATGVLRSHHRLQPKEADDFSLNELSLLSNILDVLFTTLNRAGWLVGIFAILVGMFSVANIMFVSVKERTNIIGIKKALGAKRYIILLEFLIEAIILCILGGMFGLVIVYLSALGLSSLLDFDIFLSWYNIILGLSISIIIGILSGVIPALQAARMDPVVAIRSK